MKSKIYIGMETPMGDERTSSIVIDCHYHYDEAVVPAKELLRAMDSSGVRRIALMAPMNEPIPPPGPLTAALICFFLNHRVLRSIPEKVLMNFTADGKIKLPGGTYEIFPDPDNEPVFTAVGQHPDRFLGWVFVNPNSEKDQTAVLNKWIRLKSCVGAKAHPFWHRYRARDLAEVAGFMQKINKPLLVHCGFRYIEDVIKLADDFPDLKLILAHAGFPHYSDLWRLIRKRKNLYVDLSQISYVNERITGDVVEYLGADRCLYGTDGPTGTLGSATAYDYGYIKRRIERIFPDYDIRRKLLGENFAGLIGLR